MNASEVPVWLIRLRDDLTTISEQAAREHWGGPEPDARPFYNYRLEHVRQVERSARVLLHRVGGDPDIVLAAVWIHDRFQPQFTGPQHAVRAAEWGETNLAALGFPNGKIEQVRYAVAHHSDPPGAIPRDAKEAQILWDADKLTKLGTADIVAFLCSAPAFPSRRMTVESIAEYGVRSLEEAARLVDDFYFEFSRGWARNKLRAQQAFYQALAQETGHQK